MSILNVLLRPDQLLVAVGTLAEDAVTGAQSSGAKLLLIPQYNLILATRGSTQFFIRICEMALQASFRADFTVERLMEELGRVIDGLWPAYVRAAVEAGLPASKLHTELVLGGWSATSKRTVATAYAKHDAATPAIVQPLDAGLASPGEPLEGRPDSFDPADVLAAGRSHAAWLNRAVGRRVAGGRLLGAVLRESSVVIHDLGAV